MKKYGYATERYGRFEIPDYAGARRLRFNGKKPLREIVAWSITFEKWALLTYLEEESEPARDGGRRTCGLCMMHESNACRDCPIKNAGHKGCRGTPYLEYLHNPSKEAARREFVFLLSVFADVPEKIIDEWFRITHLGFDVYKCLSFSGGQPATEREAWAITLMKWFILWTEGGLIEGGESATCGLCMMYRIGSGKNCECCPISLAGHPYCVLTRYGQYCKTESAKSAVAEFRFLLSVMDGSYSKGV